MNKTIKPKSELLETVKYYFYMFVLIVLFFVVIGILSVIKGQSDSPERKNAMAQDDIAAEAFLRVMFSGDKVAFLSLLEDTQCAVVFPAVSEADYLTIKDGRRGMASCRIKESWGASVFVVLQDAAINSEKQQNDLVFFFKNATDLINMLEGKTKFGKDLSHKKFAKGISEFEAETDVLFFENKDSNIDVKSLNQGSIQEGKKFMRKTYGRGTQITEWLKESSKYAPNGLSSFNYSIRKFEKGIQ